MRGIHWLLLGLALMAIMSVSQAQRIRQVASRLGRGWSWLHPDLQERVIRVLERVNAELDRRDDDLRLAVHMGYRDPAEQQRIIDKGDGATRVSDPLNSYHCWGLAADLVFVDKLGKWTWPPTSDPRWRLVVDAVRANGLISGADWDNDGKLGEPGEFDYPHAQLRPNGQRVADLRVRYTDRPLTFIGSFNSEAVA